MPNPDLLPTARAVADVVVGVTDDQLDLPTPCPDYTVGGMIGHLHGLAQVFAATAAKDLGEGTSTPPSPGSQDLPDDWRVSLPGHLEAMGEAWRNEAAWTGMTAAGGVDLPGEIAGLVALNELMIHGWDVAHATGQSYDPDSEAVAAVHGYLVETRKGEVPDGLFGPVVDVRKDAPLLERAVGLSGRDPGWSA